METIFDHNPTNKEIEDIVGGMTKKEYLNQPIFPEGNNFLDIALLYNRRKDNKNFEKYRQKVPQLYQEYQWGQDCLMVPIKD